MTLMSKSLETPGVGSQFCSNSIRSFHLPKTFLSLDIILVCFLLNCFSIISSFLLSKLFRPVCPCLFYIVVISFSVLSRYLNLQRRLFSWGLQPSSSIASNFVVEWLALLFRTRQVPGSDFSPETGYSNWGIFVFTQFLHSNIGMVP
jgi:hypothetical protein